MQSNTRKTAWVTSEATILTTGNTAAGNSVFFIRLVCPTIIPTDVVRISAKRNHGVRPAVNQTTKGALFSGLALKPILKTNQNTKIRTRG